jgi:hypothetical protein
MKDLSEGVAATTSQAEMKGFFSLFVEPDELRDPRNAH